MRRLCRVQAHDLRGHDKPGSPLPWRSAVCAEYTIPTVYPRTCVEPRRNRLTGHYQLLDMAVRISSCASTLAQPSQSSVLTKLR